MKLAVIPARGGSKRIPRKNVRSFGGQPMIAYAIDAARRTALFDHIVVSTDDREIAGIAKAHGAEVPFMRPPHLADDHTPTVPVIAHAIRECAALGLAASTVCCIYPGVPFLQTQDLQAAHQQLIAQRAPYVFPVCEFSSPVQRALLRRDDGTVTPLYPQYAQTRTQDLQPAYHDAGQFYIGPVESWLAELNLHLHGHTIVLPSWRVVDIDTPDDWIRAEAMLALNTSGRVL